MKSFAELERIFCCMFLGFGMIAAAADFHLVKDGKAQAVIIRNQQAEAAQDFLVREAAKCGVTLNLADAAKNGNKIVFNVKKVPMEQEDAFTIDFPDRRTMRISCSPVSARWAANHLLETAFGVRWVFPHLKLYGKEDINDYPKAGNISVKTEKYEQKPYSVFLNRKMVYRFSDWTPNWGQKASMGHGHWITIDGFPVWKYAPDQSWPEEIMPVLKGKKLKLPKPKSLPLPKNPYLAKGWAAPNRDGVNYHSNWNPCFSHPKTAEIAIANILEKLDREPTLKCISLSINDDGGFCQCNDCMKAVKGKNSFSRYLNYSDLFWGWMNKVAEGVGKKYPDVFFYASAYREVMNPPSFKLHPKVLVQFAFEINNLLDPEMRKLRLKQMKEWSGRCSHLMVYDYDYGIGKFLLPRLTTKVHSEAVKQFHREFNLRGLSTEAFVSPFDGPKYYLMYRLMRDVNDDPDRIMDTWYRNAVGPKAAPALRKFYEFWDHYWTGPEIRKTQWYKTVTNIYLQLGERPSHTFALKHGDMKKLRALMTEVVEKAETPQQKRRAKVLMKYFELSEAAAQALFSELISPEGKLLSSADAVELLRQVPAALEAGKRFRSHPYHKVGRRSEESLFNITQLNIGLIMPFIKDPAVQAELRKLEKNRKLPAVLRAQIKIWLGVKAENLMENGSFEEAQPMIKPLWSKRLNGKRDTRHASDGKYSFRAGNGSFLMMAKMEAGKTYLLLWDLFIETGSNEGRFGYRLGPFQGNLVRRWYRNEFIPTGGVWNTYSVVVHYPKNKKLGVDRIRVHLFLKNFERTEPVWLDNFRFYCLDDLKLEEAAE